MEASRASTLSRGFSPFRNGVLATRVRFMRLHMASPGLRSGEYPAESEASAAHALMPHRSSPARFRGRYPRIAGCHGAATPQWWRSPGFAMEDHVVVDPGDVFRLGCAPDANVQQVLFVPKTGFHADGDVVYAIEAANAIFITMGAFDHGKGDARVEHVPGEFSPVLMGCLMARRVAAGREHMQTGRLEYFGLQRGYADAPRQGGHDPPPASHDSGLQNRTSHRFSATNRRVSHAKSH